MEAGAGKPVKRAGLGAALQRSTRTGRAAPAWVLLLALTAALLGVADRGAADEGCVSAECHADIGKLTVKHGPVREGRCSRCHQQARPKHPGERPSFRFVHGGGKDLCFSCHLDFGAGLANSQHFHRPVEQGDCEGCHVPHGSKEEWLLIRPYRTEINLPFAAANHTLCWDCHNQALVFLESTKKITEFRNGARNLHFTHVTRPPVGTGCRACHVTHGSKPDRLIRQATPFADAWAPIRGFETTAAGGRCDSSCHSSRSYDRENPVTNF